MQRGPGSASPAAAAPSVEQEGRGGAPAHARRPRCHPAPPPPARPPHLRAPRAASRFRTRHAAAILFTSRPRPEPPRRRGPAPRDADVPARWPGRHSPPRPAPAVYWAVWTRAGGRAGIGSRSAPPQGWILLAHWSAEAPPPWGGAGSGRGEVRLRRRPRRGLGLWLEVGGAKRLPGTSVKRV